MLQRICSALLQTNLVELILCLEQAIRMTKSDQLWMRYWAIRDDHQNGLRMPILWHLALRGDGAAMLELSNEVGNKGRIADRFSQDGFAYAAYRKGNPLGAQHLAMNAFNRNDLRAYRYWLNKAARAGDSEAASERRRFEIRLPHANAALIRRKRPWRRSD